jgi:hypothetical protein
MMNYRHRMPQACRGLKWIHSVETDPVNVRFAMCEHQFDFEGEDDRTL